ncbi:MULTISPECIES: dTDP-4-amino-4,6-dideoxy-D-galactose acyltransferase [Pantoea]|uniref:dTDP-fucosamine acetyltransferase n=1 Tax=Pantoea stewartii subsp. stewartii DC283 TaxID=660596 RepID=H3RIU6_PANSE|nr:MULTISPECIES: dTDP-4-amino-4,6-dideoxy-D-galactose acyltransferase [Pantoea]KKW51806.1 TDP-fucosamine acetyltransferase [Pantoea ananatis]ARF51730.1 TDP-D-fucosamine acetyltransferase [Pantoea stewartii subsp. stewartii DC283]EHT98804.1 lipopolysaccharide biosynthesis protein [Pantoea stewartii subsp. stewartii DC283]KAB0558186.1 dTDP-4-amino-4,6-dideoxy-D-galactose acyltransferase [Pantoea stewartii subsp. stewartii]KGD85465.1 TDP-fucosamine acetyltransferase [Pantoea stewartii subsp. indo
MSVHVKVNPLDWESQFFGIQSVRLETGGTLPLESALQHPCALFQIKVPADQTATIDALNQHQFQLVEGEAELSLTIKRTERQTGVRIARQGQIPALREAASQAFRQSRFRSPWFAPEESGRFYAQWIENAVLGTFDHQCLVACDDSGALQGFVSLREVDGDARIGLLAVVPAAQGQSIGQRLMLAAADWGRVRQLDRLRVATQISNLTAMRLYLRSGARLESTAYWFYRRGHDSL